MTGVYEPGTVCVKTLGREAGYMCVVLEIIDKNFALVEGTNVRRRRSNFNHLIPTGDILEVKKGAKSEDVKKIIEKSKLKDKFATKIVPVVQL
jgi:large subunit ribosomal protein L14e